MPVLTTELLDARLAAERNAAALARRRKIALSHPVRQHILALLQRCHWLYGEEIRALIELHFHAPIEQTRISKHLKILAGAKLVSRQKVEQTARWSVTRDGTTRAAGIVRRMLQAKLDTPEQDQENIT